jgi:hypothetical protein
MVIESGKNEIEIMLGDLEKTHSEYQIENFIVGCEVHPWHRYKQALRELASRREAVIDLNDKLSYLEGEIKRMQGRRYRYFHRWRLKTAKEKTIDFYQLKIKKRERKKLIISIAGNKKERKCFARIATQIRRKHGFDSLTYEKRKAIEAEAWREKAKWMVCLDYFCLGQPSKQTIEFIAKFPKAIRRELINDIAKITRNEVTQYLIDV